MKISMYLSTKERQGRNALFIVGQVASYVASHKMAANIVPMCSAVPGVSDNYRVESGCRIDLLSVPENRFDDVLYLWEGLRPRIGINCVYLDISSASGNIYSGCICDWGYYRANYRLIHPNGKVNCTCA